MLSKSGFSQGQVFPMHIDLRVLEILSSKICHDLISPVSAINNGVELIEDIGAEIESEALNLIADSAANAARRLRFFRVAYGRAGSEENLPLRDIKTIAEQYFSVGKIKLLWGEEASLPGIEGARGALKVLVNLLIMAEEVLAYGGQISIKDPKESQGRGCALEVTGRNAILSTAFRDALEDKVAPEDLTPRTIQPYIVGRFAAAFDLRILHSAVSESKLDLFLQVSPPAYDIQQDV